MDISKTILLTIMLMGISIPINTTIYNDVATYGYEQTTNLIEINDIYDIHSSNHQFIYFGRPTCPNCQNFQPLFEKALKETNTTAYYINTDIWRYHPSFNEIVQLYEINSVPTVIKLLDNGDFKVLDLRGLDNNQDIYMAILNFLG